ncbi:MAG: alpha/beta hydrolase [Pseudomonadales bacterium]
MIPVAERFFQVNGYQLAAKEWHTDAAIKVIACHGWLDNAASFDGLAPLLTACHVVAMDMPGHGHSDHKSPQASYNIWDDLLDILAVADALNWQTFNLLGHSRGGIMSMLLGAAMPERVQAMVMLDAIVPMPIDIADTAKQLHKFLTQQRSIHKKQLPRYTSIDEATSARCRGARMSEASAKQIVERGIKKMHGYYHWSNDPRLNTASAFKLTEDHNMALLNAIKIPSLLLLAEGGLGSIKGMVDLAASCRFIHYQLMAGSHHFHMEEQAPIIADKVQHFFSSHKA